ncbi:SH3 domain-containing protein [Luteococcus japonicus]|uniref:SH3b domain-containing protein n=1 Tax=Luteococcus japonicus LSP_Lj1 TaxID=1255658 RepID=A0A1R4KIV4_9ACTN|nr:SH3 domain-containing protein [Luteococcus japonicus]SJN44306.1 hypothetical protein FM114_14955 [Luteococcus japonicus LSP_Lj1]
MSDPRHAQLDSDANATETDPVVDERVVEQAEPLAVTDELHFEAEPFSLRRALAPLALVAGLAVAAGGAVLLPSSANEDVVETATTTITSTESPAADAKAISRSTARPAVATPKPSASVRASSPAARPSTPAASVTPTKKATPSRTATPSVRPYVTPSRSASASPSATTTVPALGKITGTRYATATVNVRQAPDLEADRIGSLVEGDAVKVTALRQDGWRQVSLDGRAGWVRADYLSLAKPKSTVRAATSEGAGSSTKRTTSGKPQSTQSPRSQSSSNPTQNRQTSGATRQSGSGTRSGTCASDAVESGLTANAVNVHRAVCGSFPSITNFGGARGSDDAHGSGRALDIMVSGETGWQVARWARANASSLGITEVIYSQQIWTTQRSSEGWRSMSDRGSATANHYDHVHVTVR